MREAIFRLISEQGLEMQAATAVYVPYVNSEKLREIQQIRFHLEGMGAAEAAQNITRKQLDNLIALQRDFISCTATDPKRASYLNRKFHFAILEASNKPILRNTVESFWVITGPISRCSTSRRRDWTIRKTNTATRPSSRPWKRAIPKRPGKPSRPTWSGAARS